MRQILVASWQRVTTAWVVTIMTRTILVSGMKKPKPTTSPYQTFKKALCEWAACAKAITLLTKDLLILFPLTRTLINYEREGSDYSCFLSTSYPSQSKLCPSLSIAPSFTILLTSCHFHYFLFTTCLPVVVSFFIIYNSLYNYSWHFYTCIKTAWNPNKFYIQLILIQIIREGLLK